MTHGTEPPVRRRLLLVTYYHPPMPFLGGDPWSGLTSHLRKLGHSLTIVTTGAYGSLTTDAENQVLRTTDLTRMAVLRRVLRRPALAGEGAAATVAKAPPAILDAHDRARRVSVELGGLGGPKRSPRDPPGSHRVCDHDIAAGLDAPCGPVARLRTVPPGLQTYETAGCSRGSASRSRHGRSGGWIAGWRPRSCVVPIRRRRRRYRWWRTSDPGSGRHAGLVSNAWDEDLEPDVARADPPELDRARREPRLHRDPVGSPRSRRSRAPDGAAAAGRRGARDGRRRLRLAIAGRLVGEEAKILAAPDLRPVVQLAGALPRTAAIAFQRQADALLLVTSNDKSIVTPASYSKST